MKHPYRSLSTLLALAVMTTAWGASQLTWPTLAAIEIAPPAGKFDFLRVDGKRNRLLAAHEVAGTMDIIDLTKHALITRVKVGKAPVDTAVDADSKLYYVSVQDDERVAVLDAVTLKEVNSIKVSGPTDAILYEPKNRRVYVTHDNGADVWVIDPQTARVVATVVIPGVPEFMVYDAASDRIYLNIKSKDVVAVIDPSANKVLTQWSTAPATQPHGLAFDSASHRLYTAGANGKLVAIDTGTGSAVGSVDITAKVDQIALDSAGGLLYCAGNDQISVVRVSGGQLARLGELATAATAKNVAIDPATHAVWTTYSDGKSSFAKAWSAPQP